MDTDTSSMYLATIAWLETSAETDAEPRSALGDARSRSPLSKPPQEYLTPCLACTATLPLSSLLTLDCGHSLCPPCISQLLLFASRDERVHPAKCCNLPLPLALIADRGLVDERQTRAYERMGREKAVKGGKERVYCADVVSCGGVFVGERTAEKGAPSGRRCDECGEETCLRCRGAWHGTEKPCSLDADLAEQTFAASLLVTQQARRCPSCRRLVSRLSGCPFVTCICGETFCDLCGAIAEGHWCRCAEGRRYEGEEGEARLTGLVAGWTGWWRGLGCRGGEEL